MPEPLLLQPFEVPAKAGLIVCRPGVEPTHDDPQGGKRWHYLTPGGAKIDPHAYLYQHPDPALELPGWFGSAGHYGFPDGHSPPGPATREHIQERIEAKLREEGIFVVDPMPTDPTTLHPRTPGLLTEARRLAKGLLDRTPAYRHGDGDAPWSMWDDMSEHLKRRVIDVKLAELCDLQRYDSFTFGLQVLAKLVGRGTGVNLTWTTAYDPQGRFSYRRWELRLWSGEAHRDGSELLGAFFEDTPENQAAWTGVASRFAHGITKEHDATKALRVAINALMVTTAADHSKEGHYVAPPTPDALPPKSPSDGS